MHAWRWIDRLAGRGPVEPHPAAGHRPPVQLRRAARDSRAEGAAAHRIAAARALAQVESLPEQAGNPYVGTNGKGAVGLDAKVGLASNFTMDATVNPDFGQVEADPSVVNLTTYETFYEEKRPFFLEGKRIFTLGLPGSAIAGDESGASQGDQLFYSRRIGAPPPVQPLVRDGAYLETPGETSIISAVKVTGKTNDGLSVGPAAERDRQRARQRLVQWRGVARARGADDELRRRTRPEGLGQGQHDPRRHVHVHSSLAARRRSRAPVADRRLHWCRGRDALLQGPLLRHRGQGGVQPHHR